MGRRPYPFFLILLKPFQETPYATHFLNNNNGVVCYLPHWVNIKGVSARVFRELETGMGSVRPACFLEKAGRGSCFSGQSVSRLQGYHHKAPPSDQPWQVPSCLVFIVRHQISKVLKVSCFVQGGHPVIRSVSEGRS